MKIILSILAYICLLLGVVGIFAPLLPGVPFLLLAVFLFERTSPKVHNWIVQHPRLGPPVTDWYKHRVIRTKPKLIAITLIASSISYAVIFKIKILSVKIIAASVGVSLIAFIASRKSRIK